jgi:hypothetical protein
VGSEVRGMMNNDLRRIPEDVFKRGVEGCGAVVPNFDIAGGCLIQMSCPTPHKDCPLQISPPDPSWKFCHPPLDTVNWLISPSVPT